MSIGTGAGIDGHADPDMQYPVVAGIPPSTAFGDSSCFGNFGSNPDDLAILVAGKNSIMNAFDILNKSCVINTYHLTEISVVIGVYIDCRLGYNADDLTIME